MANIVLPAEQHMDCLSALRQLSADVDETNLDLTKNVIRIQNSEAELGQLCVTDGVTYQWYYETLAKKWSDTMESYLRENVCEKQFSLKISRAGRFITGDVSDTLEDIILEEVADQIEFSGPPTFTVDPDLMVTLSNLTRILVTRCSCKLPELFRMYLGVYGDRWRKSFQGLTRPEIIQRLRNMYVAFKASLTEYALGGFGVGNVYGLYKSLGAVGSNSTVESELNKLIPSELGPMKDFFVTTISAYYADFHPIFWAQVLKSSIDRFVDEAPLLPSEWFAFLSKGLLLNSGPFILKILQAVRPVLTPELAAKYNLTKLSYPLMHPDQVQMVCRSCISEWENYQILANYSASVGHVVKAKHNDSQKPIIIKIIKPLAAAQSCREFQELKSLFPRDSCEDKFVRGMLISNKEEMNVDNEIKNIDRAVLAYPTSYRDVFGLDCVANLDTVRVVRGVVDPVWYCMAMTFAEGVPVSKLIEDDLLGGENNVFRATLHRSLDLLVYRFFQGILEHKFYHGDLHAGNIIFDCKTGKLTMIDFGAVGEMNLFSDDPDIEVIIQVAIMATFHNYVGILDLLSQTLNQKCQSSSLQISYPEPGKVDVKDGVSSQITGLVDTSSPAYRKMQKKLLMLQRSKMGEDVAEKRRTQIMEQAIFSQDAIVKERTLPKPKKENGDPELGWFGALDTDGEADYCDPKRVIPGLPKIPDSENPSSNEIMADIIKFFATNGVNVAVKFNEFYEFQKAYALLLGVLKDVGYSGYRTSTILSRVFSPANNLGQLTNLGSILKIGTFYLEQARYSSRAWEKLNRIQPE